MLHQNQKLQDLFKADFRPLDQSQDQKYRAGFYRLLDQKIIYRKARITPKKCGQFVAIWKRDDAGQAVPYHFDDEFDLMVIDCVDGASHGQFVFDKKALVELGYIQTEQQRGKNGVRLYPEWVEVENLIALKSKGKQAKYFLNLNSFDADKARSLYQHRS